LISEQGIFRVGAGRPLVMVYLPQPLLHQGGNISFHLLPLDPVLLYTGHAPVRDYIPGLNAIQSVTNRVKPALIAKAKLFCIAPFLYRFKNSLY
jgi:hypothetical protein